MAHFAEIDENNVVLRVVVVHDNCVPTENAGNKFLSDVYGNGERWVQCSYHSGIRKNYAGIGYTYNPTRDAFIAPKPFPSWILDEQKCRWEPPVDHPKGNGKRYVWNEQDQKWDEAAK